MAAKKTKKATTKKTAPAKGKTSRPKEKPAKKALKKTAKAAPPKKKAASAKKPVKKAVARPKAAPKKAAPVKKVAAPKKVEAPKKASKVVAPPPKSAPRSKVVSEPPKKIGKAAKVELRSEPPPKLKPGKGAKPVERAKIVPREPPRIVTLALPVLPPVKRATIEERSASIEKRLAAQDDEFRQRYIASFDMSWIYHDSALEGVVYTFEELRTALSGQPPPPVTDTSLQPTYDDIKRHKEAIEFVRDFAEKKRLPVTLDIFKKIYLILHPEEGDVKTVKYRKDVPQHRLYFHEYTPPDKIAYKVRQVVDWLNEPETRKTRGIVRIAARAHYDLVRVYPFPSDSGKVARLFMNLLLMRAGLPPSIVHSTERQRYYEALKGSANTILQMVQEAVENALSSVEKLLDEHETKKRAFVS